MDRPDKRRAEPVEHRGAKALLNAGRDPGFSSAAARSVNVNAMIDAASAPSASNSATRCATTSDFPEPATSRREASAPSARVAGTFPGDRRDGQLMLTFYRWASCL
jgi:hypothetical protein